jgi:hypothetical protein
MLVCKICVIRFKDGLSEKAIIEAHSFGFNLAEKDRFDSI